ncbi:hypothetical protein PMZ80_008886 [Knufia obscura]|uniref:Uncharacterized protein n=1 Tax=Knufia obscura TaxID=1635080 RepID=A0ABR0REZ7_9EURO|nr:hypothetical protein PMZ80_008886 [Knufia obscura]
MLSFTISAFLLLTTTLAQSTNSSGYTDYNLSITGDDDSTLYETASTPGTSNSTLPPDVYLNASLHVGEIDILVEELTAKINVDAQVLNLLDFSAGVDVSIGRVNLLIQNVTAKVLLEARLQNLVLMVESILDSVDLNPIIAELGNTVGEVVGDVGDALGGAGGSTATGSGSAGATNGSTTLTSRGFEAQLAMQHGILYAVNDYRGNTHTNRVLEQNGEIVDMSLDNNGVVHSTNVVGTFESLMEFTGQERQDVIIDGAVTTEKEYRYLPFPGLEVLCQIFLGAGGNVVGTRLVAEVEGGGSSIISGREEE